MVYTVDRGYRGWPVTTSDRRRPKTTTGSRKRERERESDSSIIQGLHSKPPEAAQIASTTRTPCVRVLRSFVLWTDDFDPAVQPGRRFTGLLSNGGIIRCHVSEHLLGYNGFETNGSWISSLSVDFVFYKYRRDLVFIKSRFLLQGSFVSTLVACLLSRGVLSK